LKENPWKEFENTLKKGDIVSGLSSSSTSTGHLFLSNKVLQDLLTIQDLFRRKLKKTLELGKTYNFQITLFEPKNKE